MKSIPLGVGKRLSRISANKAVFDAAVPPYQDALKKSGYDNKLEFEPKILGTKKKTRSRKITWFNPPFSASVKTNVGQEFLKLIDRSFPPTNPLHKLFTRQTVKVSYKCMPSMAQAVSRHNMCILHDDQQNLQQPGCNCRGGPGSCPVQGKCLTDGVVYRAAVTETGSGNVEFYTGATGNTFKKRWDGHNTDCRYEKNRKNSRYSGHIWKLKDESKSFETEWKLIDRATTFNPITRKCRVCLKEKFYIMYHSAGSTLNKRHEIFNTCRHKNWKLLAKVKT